MIIIVRGCPAIYLLSVPPSPTPAISTPETQNTLSISKFPTPGFWALFILLGGVTYLMFALLFLFLKKIIDQ